MKNRNKFFILFFILIISLFFYQKFFSSFNLEDVRILINYLSRKIENKTNIINNNINDNNILNINGNHNEVIVNSNNNIAINNDIIYNNNTNTNTDTKEINNNTDYIKIPTPFICQAPTGNWDLLHEEACEEVSLLIVYYFSEKRELILSKEAEEDIQKISKYVKANFSSKDDLNIFELKKLAEDYFKLKNLKIIENPQIKDLEDELALGNLIIAPMAGRKLNNPFFKNPGPLYHMLVLSGYDRNKKIFITQDPGTKRGSDFIYSYETILEALHDFTDKKENIEFGEKRILVFQR